MPPLVADRRRRPDRRQVSIRWLSGTLLTAVTSTLLMGVALRAALDDHASIVRPAQASHAHLARNILESKGGRVVATALPVARSRQVFELPTMVSANGREVVTTQPFGYVNMLLGAQYPNVGDYPAFDPLALFADGEPDEEPIAEADRPRLYGARVGSEVTLSDKPFAFDSESYAKAKDASVQKSIELVGSVMPRLAYQPIRLASLSEPDPLRFGIGLNPVSYQPSGAFRIVEENVSFSVAEGAGDRPRFHEEVLTAREPIAIADLLARAGMADENAGRVVEALSKELGRNDLEAGDALRAGVETDAEGERLIRLSAYRGDRHLASVAETTDGPVEPADPPELGQSVAKALDDSEAETPLRSAMPRIYDGIYQAAMTYGLTPEMSHQLVRLLGNEVDLKARLGPDDRLQVFYTLEKGESTATESSDLLFVEAHFDGQTKRFYRFRPDGAEKSDFFDSDGKSADHFLLRKPVPRGRFTSGFSTGRKHPVLGYTRPHWGVDWAAPRGTKILASGDGVVVEAGWSNGYGRRTVIRHANGYQTTYAHQSSIASGIKPGAHVKQGQVIGLVGSTGLSTGNHLHYEVAVNGKRVDPMRIKLPAGTTLAGSDLEAFRAERDEIDKLLSERIDMPLVARN